MPSIVCVVVHPSRIVREGLTSILAKSQFEPACTAPSIESVPSTIAGGGEQVLALIGVSQGSDLCKCLPATKASFPDAHVLVIGDAANRDLVTTALALGATSFVDDNVATAALIKELERVARGELSVPVPERLLPHFSAPPCEEAVATPTPDDLEPPEIQDQFEQTLHLSDREAAILNALVRGASNKVIANELSITEATVKVHVKAILRKTRVKNRTQAAIWALHCRGVPRSLHTGNGRIAPHVEPSAAWAKGK